MKKPIIMGMAVRIERRRNEDVFPAETSASAERTENRTAERPKPDIMISAVVPRWNGYDLRRGGKTEGRVGRSPRYPGTSSLSS